VGAELIHEDGQKDILDMLIGAVRYLYECAQKLVTRNLNDRVRKTCVAFYYATTSSAEIRPTAKLEPSASIFRVR